MTTQTNNVDLSNLSADEVAALLVNLRANSKFKEAQKKASQTMSVDYVQVGGKTITSKLYFQGGVFGRKNVSIPASFFTELLTNAQELAKVNALVGLPVESIIEALQELS